MGVVTQRGLVRSAAARLAFSADRVGHGMRARFAPFDHDLDAGFHDIYWRAKPFTMTPVERMYAMYEAIRHAVAAGIAGDIVECGVWRGGSMMIAALALEAAGDRRRLHLYDTFEGMTKPGAVDVSADGRLAALPVWSARRGRGERWVDASLEDVRQNMATTGYPDELLEYHVGPVEETVTEATAPGSIALLRLDTDWYESTRHELEVLYPRLAPGGVLIVDDYGYWRGARQAVDEYLATLAVRPFLVRTDLSARVGVKPHQSPGSFR